MKTNKTIDGRKLHEQLRIKTRYADWIKRRIDKYGFIENIDYFKTIISKETFNTIKTSKEYKITLDMAKQLCRFEKNNPNTKDVLKYLYKLDDGIEPIILDTQKRYEYIFGDMLSEVTGIKWETQYPINGGKHRLDFYLPNYLIVEYDEEQHQYQKEADKEREDYCLKWLKENETNKVLPIIRVDKGNEFKGLNKIIKN